MQAVYYKVNEEVIRATAGVIKAYDYPTKASARRAGMRSQASARKACPVDPKSR